MITINEANVIAMKPANIDFLQNAYKSKKPEKNTSVSDPLQNSMPIDNTAQINSPMESAPIMNSEPVDVQPTNAQVIANEFATPAAPISEMQPVAPISQDQILPQNETTPEPVLSEIQPNNDQGNLILEIISDITRLQGQLDAIGEKVILLSNNQKLDSNQPPIQPAMPEVSVMQQPPIPEPVSPSLQPQPETQPSPVIVPFTPASENIFDQPANQGMNMAA